MRMSRYLWNYWWNLRIYVFLKLSWRISTALVKNLFYSWVIRAKAETIDLFLWNQTPPFTWSDCSNTLVTSFFFSNNTIFWNWIIKKIRHKRINYLKIANKIVENKSSEERYALLVIKIYSKDISMKTIWRWHWNKKSEFK